jgi:hypothetical protein
LIKKSQAHRHHAIFCKKSLGVIQQSTFFSQTKRIGFFAHPNNRQIAYPRSREYAIHAVKMSGRNPMSGADARRIMSSEYARNGQVEAGSFASRAQSAAQRNMNSGLVPDWSASANSGQSKGSGGEMRGGGRKN